MKALGLAKALDGEETLASLGAPAAREVTVRRVWGVPTPTGTAPPLVRAADRRGSSPTSWGLAGVEAALRHEEALEVLLGIATREKHLVRLGEEIQETSRRVNALDQLLLPALAREARRVGAALEERDREGADGGSRHLAGDRPMPCRSMRGPSAELDATPAHSLPRGRA